MPRHQPSDKPDPGEVLKGPVRMRRDAQGRLQIVDPAGPTKATIEAKPKPPQPDDPRSAAIRDVGPAGGFA